MDVAVIGAGSIGRRHIAGISGLREELGVGVIRVFDHDRSRSEEAASAAAGVSACATLEGAVLPSGAVFICAPTAAHARIAETVLALGEYHLFVEKPLGSSARGWAEILEGHRRTGKTLAVGYMLRKHPVLRRLKELLGGGQFGRVLHVRAESGFYLPYWHPYEDYRRFYMASRTAGGGALLDTSHEIDYLTWLFGPVAEARGTIETVSDLEITSDDLVLATFAFKSGVRGQIHLDLLQFDESRYCKVIATRGVVRGDLVTNELRFWREGDRAWTVERLDVSFDGLYASEYRDFFGSCRGEPNEAVDGESALHVLEVVEAVRRSHACGAPVRLPLWDI